MAGLRPEAQHSTAQHSTAQHSTAQHHAAQHRTAASLQPIGTRHTYLASKSKQPVHTVRQGHTPRCADSNLQCLDDVGAHEGLLAFFSGLKGVLLSGLSLLTLGLLESALQPLHPLMHPHIPLEPPLPASHWLVLCHDSVPACLQAMQQQNDTQAQLSQTVES